MWKMLFRPWMQTKSTKARPEIRADLCIHYTFYIEIWKHTRGRIVGCRAHYIPAEYSNNFKTTRERIRFWGVLQATETHNKHLSRRWDLSVYSSRFINSTQTKPACGRKWSQFASPATGNAWIHKTDQQDESFFRLWVMILTFSVPCVTRTVASLSNMF